MNIPYELLIKYCKGKCSETEKVIIESWIHESDEHLNRFIDLRNEWTKNIDDIAIVMPDKNKVLAKINNRINRKSKSQINILQSKGLYLLFATVILFIGVCGGYFLSADSSSKNICYTVIATDKGEKTKVNLADGSKIWLNELSQLKFNNNFNLNSRSIEATGELYLEVAHNPQQKFTVDIGLVQIQVLGTSFTVRAEKNENGETEISLLDGKIEVMNIADNTHLFNLNSSQRALINHQNMSYTIFDENTEDAKLWTKGKLSIYDMPIAEVVRKLEHWYGIQITYIGFDPDTRYTFLLTKESIMEFLVLFDKITSIRYSLESNKLTITKL